MVMSRLGAITALLLGSTALASAQNVVCPTRPAGDSTNACASTAFVQAAVPLAAITSLTGPITAAGPGAAATTIAAGAVTSGNLASGAAATNVGTLGGDLNGSTLPNPTISSGAVTGAKIASGTVANSNLSSMAARTLKSNPTGSSAAPVDIPINQLGYVSVFEYGASGSILATTGTIGATSSSLALSAAQDFANGQGIRVDHAGVAPTNVGTPTSPSVANVGAAGGTTYTYQVTSFDSFGGVGVATSTFQTTTGNAALGTTNYNLLSWTAPAPAPAGYAIWRSSTLIGLTANITFADQGQTAPVAPDWLPATAPASALADSLLTTISSGGGTTTLTLAATSATAASGQPVNHDDSAAIQACLAASAANAAVKCFAAGVFQVGAQLVWPSTGSVGLVGAGRGWFAAGPPTNVGLPGTKLIATQNVFCVICAVSGSFTNGNYISDLTIDGNTIATIPLDIGLWGSSTIYNVNVNNALSGGDNFQLGHSGQDPIENTIFAMRLDNPLLSHNVPNLPTYSLEVGSTNNNLLHIKAVNSRVANIHTTSGLSFNNTFHGVHGYNFDYSIATATGPTNNFLLEGSADQFTSWEADGSSAANVQINGFSNLISGGVSQFQTPLTAQIGIRFGTGTCLNSVINNQIANSSAANTVVQTGSPCAGENLVWQNFNNTNNTISGLTSDIAGHIRVGAGGAAAPTLTAGCNGAGSSVRSDSTDFSWHITGQTAAATTCTITFSQSFLTTVSPRCVVSGETVAPSTIVPTASTVVINFASTATAVFDGICVGI
jgi:hypothetical protein